ncbi:OmpA family protein [Roseivirga sp. BDSF3-8]|uniref:OmpA family protein n=1 Tax=Roseivirga sp. BDSF3-8 TaxID=3241598 RepID=UPI0035327995
MKSPQKQCKKLRKNRSGKKPFISFRFLFGKKPDPSVVKVPYRHTKPREILAEHKEEKREEEKQKALAKKEEIEEKKKNDLIPLDSLPPTISEKHARIRKEVRKRLEEHEEGEPLIIEPLYFITAQDEFAFVDMDPFLLAVEFAMQGRIVLVEGHTDDRGDENYNLQLSMKRVGRIQQLMHDIGVPDERISVIGYGESQPSYDNSTEEGRQKNRRVDFTVF